MATIPLHVGQYRRDAGNAVHHPDGSAVSGAMRSLGDQYFAVAQRYEQRRAQQEAFDTELLRRKLNSQIVQAEDEAEQDAPADGAGLHDAMYGQRDPHTGLVEEPGRFDTLFGAVLRQVPADQQASFVQRKEALREAGALRMATRQIQRRKDYELAQVSQVLDSHVNAIAKGDPADDAAFEAFRQDGLDLIVKTDLDPQIQLQLTRSWFADMAKTRVEAQIARDPKGTLEMLGAAAKGDRLGKPTPDESVAQGFGAQAGAESGGALPNPWIVDLSPDAVQALDQKARVATAVQLIGARANIDLAARNAPAAIADTGTYSGEMPGPEAFIAVHGVEEGGKQFQDFSRKIDIGRRAFDMRILPNQAIHAALRDAEPGPGGSQEELARYQATAAAAIHTLDARRADPAGYVRKVLPNVDAAWNRITRPDSGSWNRRGEPDSYDPGAYEKAIAASVAAQKHLGIETLQPLPWSVLQNVVATLNDKDVPQADKDIVLRDLSAATSDPEVRAALSRQLAQAAFPQPGQSEPTRPVPATVRQTGPLPPSARRQSTFDDFAEDLGATPGRIKNDTAQFFRDLRDDPLEAIVALSSSIPNPASGAPAESIAALRALGQAVSKGVTTLRNGGSGKLAKPLEEALSEGADLYKSVDDLPKRSSELAADVGAKSQTPTGTSLYTYHPPNDGFVGAPVDKILPIGTRIDRYGFETGWFAAPEGTPAWMRSLMPGTLESKPYYVYEVTRPVAVLSGKTAPWFYEGGGGTQYKFYTSIGDAVVLRYLREVK